VKAKEPDGSRKRLVVTQAAVRMKPNPHVPQSSPSACLAQLDCPFLVTSSMSHFSIRHRDHRLPACTQSMQQTAASSATNELATAAFGH
jgi:hypothetical protein